MKKSLSVPLLAAFIAGFGILTSCNNHNTSSASSSGSSNFEGVINYEVKIDAGSTPGAAGLANSVEMKTYVKGQKVRGEESVMGYNSVMIADSKDPDNATMLVNMFGHKYAIKITDSAEKEKHNTPKIEYIDSANTTKQIAGYTCKKAKIIINGADSAPITSFIYYTSDLPYADPQGLFKGLKGMPMEFSGNMNHVNITIMAKSVETKTLSDSLFVVPSDYKQMTMADMEKEMMQNMGGNSAPGADTNSK